MFVPMHMLSTENELFIVPTKFSNSFNDAISPISFADSSKSFIYVSLPTKTLISSFSSLTTPPEVEVNLSNPAQSKGSLVSLCTKHTDKPSRVISIFLAYSLASNNASTVCKRELVFNFKASQSGNRVALNLFAKSELFGTLFTANCRISSKDTESITTFNGATTRDVIF